MRLFRRAPDAMIGGAERPYMLRWWVIPRNRFFNVYLHKILRSDDDRALHDHPWMSCSIILKGGYIEHMPGGVSKIRKPWRVYFRRATQAHRIELFSVWQRNFFKLDAPYIGSFFIKAPRPSWSLFITGPKKREWGFHCPNGWRHWKIFVKPADTTEPGYHDALGRGCD